MARTHVDFLQAQVLPWTRAPWPHLPGCQAKLLGGDPDSGAASALVRVPPGWSQSRAGWLGAGVELLVIEGELDLNGRQYAQDAYAWLPAGYPFRSMATVVGAVALVFFEATPTWHDGVPPADAGDTGDAIEFRDAFRMPWTTEGLDRAYATAGTRWKILRGSPAGDRCTLLLACAPHLHPHDWTGPQELHDCAQETFVLSGDLVTSRGALTAGAYGWRPPDVGHGPYASRGGALALVRSSGGSLQPRWTSHDVKISREPAYRPVLPEELRGQLRQPWRPQRY